MQRLILTAIAITFFISLSEADDFDVLFEGHGDIESYIYFKQDTRYFIDTELYASIETFRYRRFYLIVDLFEETHMGRKFNSNMVFDPSRAHWSFGLAGRIELDRYFFEAQIRHDCFHDIDRFQDNSIYWNSPRIGFGTINYLSKYKYHRPDDDDLVSLWENKFDYFILAGFYAPKGINWQKNHDYDFTLSTNFQYYLIRYRRVGFDIESNNLWVLNNESKLKRQHELDFNFTIYGNSGAMVTFFRYWPYDDQSIRSRADHKWAFGIHLGF